MVEKGLDVEKGAWRSVKIREKERKRDRVPLSVTVTDLIERVTLYALIDGTDEKKGSKRNTSTRFVLDFRVNHASHVDHRRVE